MIRRRSLRYFATDHAGVAVVEFAIVSPVLWFGGIFLLTRHSGTVAKLAWQALGVVLLVPWIFVVGV